MRYFFLLNMGYFFIYLKMSIIFNYDYENDNVFIVLLKYYGLIMKWILGKDL